MGTCFSSAAATRSRPAIEASSAQAEPAARATRPSPIASHSLVHDLPAHSHPSHDASLRPRQSLTPLAGSNSQAGVRGTEPGSGSLGALRMLCDPQRMGLTDGSELALEVEDPYEPGKTVPSRKALKDMLHVMGFDRKAQTDAGRGMNTAGVAFATRVFAAAVEQVASASGHETALLAVAAALKHSGHLGVFRQPERTSEGEFEQNFTIRLGIHANDMADRLHGLRVGEHAFYLIENACFAVRSSHMVGLSMSMLDAGRVRVSLANPADEIVGRFVDVPLSHIKQGLPAFFSGEAFKGICATFVPRSVAEIPTQPESGTMFTEWMKSLHPEAALSNTYFDGKPLMQPIQKGGACTVESLFALMTTTLPRDAYKLAKAACLSTVLAMGNTTGVISPRESARLEERLTSAWRGIGTELQTEKFLPRWRRPTAASQASLASRV
ncbi:MAG: hypothetical protein JF606_26520 [Burkholderiales bacterium]|jgi:hypothetical protein|nr:hypothetical protein [Burkholderiales bacterium]